MTQAELHAALKTLGLPVAYGEFKNTGKNPAPSPPFITYQFTYGNDLKADNQNYIEISNFQVELYTKNKDLVHEGNIQALLKNNRLPYEKREFYLDTEKLRQIIYEVQMIGG